MSDKSTPQRWSAEGEPPPSSDVRLLRVDRTIPNRYLRRADVAFGDEGAPDGWVVEASPYPGSWQPGVSRSWRRRLEQTAVYGPLAAVPMASEPAESTTRPPDELIDQVAAALHFRRRNEAAGAWGIGCEPRPCDIEDARALFEAGLLADVAEISRLSLLLRGMARKLVESRRFGRGWHDQWMSTRGTVHKLTAERDALLPHLAELTGQAGKLRTTEWLNTCDHLPIEEWPPAPAYKGPMVPAAERDERQDRIDTALAKLNASDQAASWEAMYDLVVEAKTILRGWASAEPAGEAIPVEELRRAALVGDQPTYECPHCHETVPTAVGTITQLDVDTHLADCAAARQFASECASAALRRDVGVGDDTSEDTP